MKKKLTVLILLILAAILMTACQAISGRAASTNASGAAAPTVLEPSPTPQATAVKAATVESTAVEPKTQMLPTDDPAARVEQDVTQAAEAYFNAVSTGNSESAADILSSFSLMVFQLTRGDAAEALQAQKIAGVRWADLQILEVQPFDDQTVLVHVSYSETGRAAETTHASATPTPAPAQTEAVETIEALWPMRLERGEWRYNWNNVIDFRTLDADAQTMSGITILPTQLTRYSDRIELSMLIQNRTNEVVVFGQVNETLGMFYFGDETVTTEKTQWILNPLRAVPSATLQIKGLFTDLPDKVEIRKWINYNVEPWYSFQMQ